MNFLLNISLVLIAYAAMEGVAWLSHKYIMHGLLWRLHKDHHRPDGKTIEHNDSFFIIFALPAIVLFYVGFEEFSSSFWLAVGITLYGISYFFVHDIFIHQRIKWLRKTDSIYLRAIRKAHKVHHKHLGKEESECFGMLWAPPKYFTEARKHAE